MRSAARAVLVRRGRERRAGMVVPISGTGTGGGPTSVGENRATAIMYLRVEMFADLLPVAVSTRERLRGPPGHLVTDADRAGIDHTLDNCSTPAAG